MTSTTAFPLPGTSDARVVARAVRESPGLLVARTRKWSRISTSGGAVDRSNNAEGARALRASRVTRAIAAPGPNNPNARVSLVRRSSAAQADKWPKPPASTQPSSFPQSLWYSSAFRAGISARCEEVNPALIEPATVQPRQGSDAILPAALVFRLVCHASSILRGRAGDARRRRVRSRRSDQPRTPLACERSRSRRVLSAPGWRLMRGAVGRTG